ncbi:hypothetical protein Ac2012v2_006802 [Leucoagaricus gongylophorus]
MPSLRKAGCISNLCRVGGEGYMCGPQSRQKHEFFFSLLVIVGKTLDEGHQSYKTPSSSSSSVILCILLPRRGWFDVYSDELEINSQLAVHRHNTKERPY